MKVKILPSLLAADFGHLEEGARRAEACGADELHLDIMDGHLVPNLSMGPAVVEMARKAVNIPLNVHLMMTNPDQHVQNFVDAGADTVLIHIEAQCNVPEVLENIKGLGVRCGITLNPDTPADMVFPVLCIVDEVLCMSVHPGYGGQKFIDSVLPKIRSIRDQANSYDMSSLDIMVDGGINYDTAVLCAAQGANEFVAGTFLYNAEDMTAATARLREVTAAALVI